MGLSFLVFIGALSLLLFSANFFTAAAERIGIWMKLPSFVVGVFIVGIGTSLPELISGILSVHKGTSEILPGNVIGANISNILLITGLVSVLNRKSIILSSGYLYVDLHFLLGSIIVFTTISFDGIIFWWEAIIGIVIYGIYAVYLIKGGTSSNEYIENQPVKSSGRLPMKDFLILLACGTGIYFGAESTITSLEDIAVNLGIPSSIIALTLLSLGTTLPELVVNIAAIRRGNAEMAIGNVLGSSVFNTLLVTGAGALIGPVVVPNGLLGFALPFMVACGLFFYLLTQDKKISVWEGLLLICLYVLFIVKTIQQVGIQN